MQYMYSFNRAMDVAHVSAQIYLCIENTYERGRFCPCFEVLTATKRDDDHELIDHHV